MTWKSRRFRLTLAARWGGNDFLLGHTGWRHVFATSFGWQKANSDSAKVRKWFVEPFPAGIFPLVCIFTWTKQTGVMTFFFDTLRHWLWDSFFFFSLLKSGLGSGFVLMVLGQKHAKSRVNACHGRAVIPTQNSALYLHKWNIWFAIFHQTWPTGSLWVTSRHVQVFFDHFQIPAPLLYFFPPSILVNSY